MLKYVSGKVVLIEKLEGQEKQRIKEQDEFVKGGGESWHQKRNMVC